MPNTDTKSIRRDAVEYCLTNDNFQFSRFAEHIQENIVDAPVGRAGLTWEEDLCMAILHSSDVEALQIKEIIDSGQFEE